MRLFYLIQKKFNHCFAVDKGNERNLKSNPQNHVFLMDLHHDMILNFRELFGSILLHNQILKLNRGAPHSIKSVNMVNNELNQLVHLLLVPDHQRDIPIFELNGEAFPRKKWKVFVV